MTTLAFSTPPTTWRSSLAALSSRKPTILAAGAMVPRLEASWTGVRIDPAHLASYRDVCELSGAAVPVTYPHVLAGPLHLALLTSARFPVRLLGLVHLANRIEALTPLAPDATGDLHCWLEGHEESERGQLFRLHTEWRHGTSVRWRETSTFLARSPTRGEKKARQGEPRPPGTLVATFDAPAGLGRRYGRIAGDLNPIHVSDATAKLFGFPRAIAHGMWSLARCAGALGAAAPCTLEVQFKLPVFLPSRVRLERTGADGAFTLLDEAGERPHLSGRLTGVAPL